MKIKYIEKRFTSKSLALIEKVNEIIAEYDKAGYELTLRQIYYQLVARAILPNSQKSYDNVGSLINDARLAGLISWTAMIDRTRFLRKNTAWEKPQDIIASAAAQYHLNRRATQTNYVEVWVEKDALVGVVGQAAEKLDVPYFSCRGYVSQTEMWYAAKRLQRTKRNNIILHLGDHDPSGIDMTRDIQERLNLFEADVSVERIALQMEQVEELKPPPNPAKLTDSRCGDYIRRFGDSSWELDALTPQYIDALNCAA